VAGSVTDASMTGAEAPRAEPRIRPAYAHYAVGLLMMIYVLNFIDRQVLSILAEPIKRELHLADWQLGAMTGLAFALLYTLLGIPIARLADRGNRPLIIASALTVWTGFTMLCGAASTFSQLMLARVGVGTGEAGCTPPAISLISDYVPKHRRTLAISIYMAGAPLGAMLGLAIGGLLADRFGWRAAFVLVGAAGVPFAALAFFTLGEPRRRRVIFDEAAPESLASVRSVLRVLWHKRTYHLVVGAVALKAFIQYGLLTFMGSFFFRDHAAEVAAAAARFGVKSAGFAGVSLGLTVGIAGVVGSICGGWLADRYGAADARVQTKLSAAGILLSTPLFVWSLLTHSMWLALWLLLVARTLEALFFGPAYSIVQGLVQPSMRAIATAVMLFVINLVGLGFGPLGVGLLSDLLSGPAGFGSGEGVRWSLATFVLLGIPAGWLFFAAGKTVREDTVS
jgi:MFS family permease